MKRVLVFGMTENPGGIESFLVNYYRRIDKKKIQFDFLCNSYEPVAYEDELLSLGARCFHITSRSKNSRKYRQELNYVFRQHANEWDTIWVNVCSLANVDYLKIAKKYKINKRIIHSHNSQNMDGLLRGLLHQFNRLSIGHVATDFWACSDDAAKWFYNKRILKKVKIIHNAINIENMCFDTNKRNTTKHDFGWDDKYIIGNVGRLHFQKNQSFAIDVFAQFHEKKHNSILVFVGQGEDESYLKNKVKDLGLTDSVFFVGLQYDIQKWLSTFDLFLFPSVFEGLGIAALEAQANGLPTVASKNVIPEEVKMNNNFVFMDLNLGAEKWSDELENASLLGRTDYLDVKEKFSKNGYDILTEVIKLERLLVNESGD